MKPSQIAMTLWGIAASLAPIPPSAASDWTGVAGATQAHSLLQARLLFDVVRQAEEKPPPKELEFPQFYQKQFPEKPAEGLSVYTLSGSQDPKAKIEADDDLIIRLNKEMIFADNDGWKSIDERGGKWKGEPIVFHAKPDDKITLVLYDLLGDEWGIGPVYLHRADGKKAVLQPRTTGQSDPDLDNVLFRTQPPGPSAKRQKKLEATWTIKDIIP
jgi:hypothetical protein